MEPHERVDFFELNDFAGDDLEELQLRLELERLLLKPFEKASLAIIIIMAVIAVNRQVNFFMRTPLLLK